MKKPIPLIYRIWKEGKYIDFWNIPHFLISLLLGYVFIYFNIALATALVLIIFLKTCWEIYEHAYVTKEAIPNKILDVLTGILAIIVLYSANQFHPITLLGFLVILALSIIFGAWGLYSMKKLDLFIKK